jgi:hypothetical protein
MPNSDDRQIGVLPIVIGIGVLLALIAVISQIFG